MSLKGLYIKTYGCQMNVYDSMRMADLLKPHGFASVDSPNDADIVILNTCHIREKAAEKVYSELGRIAKIKNKRAKENKEMMIAVSGCVAQAEGEEVVRRAPCVDIVVGPQSYHNLPTMIEEVKRKRKWVINLDFEENSKFDKLENAEITSTKSAFLSIQEGCDKFCHFCVVPYTRGAEFSRDVSAVYREAVKLVQKGTKEITLLGQNVSAYHGRLDSDTSSSLGDLIKMLAKIDGLERIRYTTSHPRDMIDDTLFEIHACEKKVMPFLHLPVQSGSNKILKSMNRKHDVEFYLKIIEKFRKYCPKMEFSSDFIIGYPGETENDFRDTLALVISVGYAQAYSFKYSSRPGTPASVLNNQVAEDIKDRRLYELQELLRKQQMDFNVRCVGKNASVLLEEGGKNGEQLFGKSEFMQSIIVENIPPSEYKRYIGEIVNVRITNAFQNSLRGDIVD